MSSKLSGTSYLPQDEFISRLRQDFPQIFTEDKIDPTKLQSNFKNLVDFDERYGLSWKGKSNVYNVIQSPTTNTLHPQREESVNFNTTDNLFIEGDNLEALKILQRSYYGKIKMIYIDPPYNTGNDFVYNDHFQEDKAEYEAESGKRDEEGNLTSQSALQKNSKDSGHYHSNWLNMMYPRLYLARNLLRDDGVIFVSIDDNEVHNLRLIMNEVFGEENFIDSIIWKKRYGGGAKEKYLVTLHEYILVFAKDISYLPDIYVPLAEEDIRKYYTLKDENYERRGAFRTHPLEATKSMSDRPNLVFPIKAPDGTDILPKRQWLWSRETVIRAIEVGEIYFTKVHDEWVVSSKQYLKDMNGVTRLGKLQSVIDDVYSQHGTNEIINLLGEAKIFSFPKPTLLLKKLVSAIAGNSDIILDFFAGSGTTAHAVMDLNAEDGGNRKWICVQLDEKTDDDSEAYKAGYKTISDIARERIRRAGKKMGKGDIGFKSLKIGETNLKIWDSAITDPEELDAQLSLMQSPVKDGADHESLLFEMMVKIGVEPTTKYKKVGEYYQVGDSLIICLAPAMTEAIWSSILKSKSQKLIVLDSSFAGNDQLKTNLILKAEKEKIEIVVV